MNRYTFLFALFFLTQVIPANAQETSKLLRQGKLLFEADSLEAASPLLLKASKQLLREKNYDHYIEAELLLAKIEIAQKYFEAGEVQLNNIISTYHELGLENDSLYTSIIVAVTLNQRVQGNFKEAFQTITTLEEKLLANNPSSSLNLANTLYAKSRVEISLGNYENAILSAKKSLPVYRRLNKKEDEAQIYNIIGVGFYFIDNIDSTLHYYTKSLKLKEQITPPDNYQLAISTFNIGIIHERLADYDKAIEYYESAEQYDLMDGEKIGVLSDIYVAFTNCYLAKEDYTKAQEYAEKALRLATKQYGPDSQNTSFVYQAYAHLLEVTQNPSSAKPYLEKSLEIRQKTYGENHLWTWESYFDLANTELLLGEDASSRFHFEQSLSIAKHLNQLKSIAVSLQGLGKYYLHSKNYVEAESHFLYALDTISVLKRQDEEFIADTQLLLAETYKENNQLKKSDSILNLIIDSSLKKSYSNKEFKKVDAYKLLADLELKKWKTAEDKQSLLNNYENIDIVSDLIASIRKGYTIPESKIVFNASLQTYLESALETCYLLYQTTQEDSFLEQAFELLELNRSSVLLEGFQNHRFKKMGGVPSSILASENELQRKLAKIKTELYFAETANEIDGEKVDRLASEQLIIRRQMDSLLNNIEKKYSKYYSLKYAPSYIDLNTLNEKLSKDEEALVSYFMGKEKLFIYKLENGKAELLQYPISKQINELVTSLRTSLQIRGNYTAIGKELYQLLVQPLELSVDNVIIIPDGVLSQLPFEILQQNDNRFLLENFNVQYVGSASLLKEQDFKFNFSPNRSTWAGFAPKYEKEQRLNNSIQEVEEIAQILNGKAYVGSKASKANFIRTARKAKILHIALHTKLDENNGLFSRLLFEDDSIDESLTVSEIYSLPIQAELAVLSACDTGYGDISDGEGILSMARAFQYAGVPSTVMSLWKVPDKETSSLMIDFYNYLKKGYSKDEALKQAKLDYLSTTTDDNLRHPYFWGGFIITGDVEPLTQKSNHWIFLFGFLLIAAILVVIYNRRKKTKVKTLITTY